MLASITPLGERARGGSWRRTATSYVIASVLGGAAFGALAGAVGRLLAAVPVPVVALAGAALAGAAALVDALGRPPSIRRQVDEGWLTAYRDWVHGTGFGLQLGFGAVTIVTSASVYLTWALELLTGSPVAGAAVGAVFGAVRALPLLAFRRAGDPVTLRAEHRRWQARLRPVAAATVATQALAAVALLAVAGAGVLT